MTSHHSGRERRSFYRIRDRIALDYEVLPENHSLPDKNDLIAHVPPGFQLIQELEQMDVDNQLIFRNIQDKDRNVAHYLTVINKKIEALGRYLAELAYPKHLTMRQVTVSGGSVSFDCNQQLEPDTRIKLEMMLFPECYGILCYGSVNTNKEASSPDYSNRLVVTFDRIRETDRDALVRHIMKMESDQIRTDRESTDSEFENDRAD